MQLKQNPFVKLLIRPHFDAHGNASSLSITQTLEAPVAQPGSTIYIHSTKVGNLKCYQHTKKNLRAYDDAGDLPIKYATPEATGQLEEQDWLVGRATDGNVILQYDVEHRKVDITTPITVRADLRQDHGGLLGAALWFAPRPSRDLNYDFVVEWDLTEAPEGTRGVWSFGEGPAPVTKTGKPEVFWRSVFMVGPVQSFPDHPTGKPTDYAGLYWFGSLPPAADRVKQFNSDLFVKMAEFFEKPAGPESSYRVFVRKSIRGYGGSGFYSSYVLEYDDDSANIGEFEIQSLLAHEMVHSWTTLGFEANGDLNQWYSEGIANLYSVLLPVEFGLLGHDYLRYTFNAYFSQYYTNPRIRISGREAQDGFFDDQYAVDIPYGRGNAYLLWIYGLLERKMEQSISEHPFHKIIKDLSKKSLGGQKVLAKDWLAYIRPYLGDRVDQDLDDMNSGKVIAWPQNIKLFDGHETLIKTEQEILDYGFARKSLDERKIIDLDPSCRAAAAGLREGDKIVWISRLSATSENFETIITVIVDRDGENVKIQFWPRSFKKAPSLQLIEIEALPMD